MFPVYRHMDSYHRGEQKPPSPTYHPIIDPTPFTYMPHGSNYGYPIPFEYPPAYSSHYHYPGFYGSRPPYPFLPPPYAPFSEAYPVHYVPPPQPIYEYGKSSSGKHHCCGCPNHSCNEKDDKNVEVGVRDDQDVEKHNSDTLDPSELKNYPYPFLWVPPGHLKNKGEGELNGIQGKELDGTKPVAWGPKLLNGFAPFDVNNLDEKRTQSQQWEDKGSHHPLALSDGKNDGLRKLADYPSKKIIPVKQMQEKAEKREKDVSVEHVIENKEKKSAEDGTKKRSSSPSNTGKLPPVCLRVEPLSRKRSSGGSSRSPSPPGKATSPRENAYHSPSKIQVEPKRNERKVITVVDGNVGAHKDEGHRSQELRDLESKIEKSGAVTEAKELKSEESTSERKSFSATDAAMIIQSAYRGFEVRKWEPLKKLRQIAKVRDEMVGLRSRIDGLESSPEGWKDDKQRLVIGESIMNLLLRLDTIQGLHPSLRDTRKSVAKELVCLQERIDSLATRASEQSTVMLPIDEAIESTREDMCVQGERKVAKDVAVENNCGDKRDIGTQPLDVTDVEAGSENVVLLEHALVDEVHSDLGEDGAKLEVEKSIEEPVVVHHSEEVTFEPEHLNHSSQGAKAIQSEREKDAKGLEVEKSIVEPVGVADTEEAISEPEHVETMGSVCVEEIGGECREGTINSKIEKHIEEPVDVVDTEEAISELEHVKPWSQGVGIVENVLFGEETPSACGVDITNMEVEKSIPEHAGDVSVDADLGGANCKLENKEVNPVLPEVIVCDIAPMVDDKEKLEEETTEVESTEKKEASPEVLNLEKHEVGTKDESLPEGPMFENHEKLEMEMSEMKMTHMENENLTDVVEPEKSQVPEKKIVKERELVEENEKLRELVEKLIEAGKEQLTAISTLSGKVRDLEKKVSKKKKMRLRRCSVTSSVKPM